MVNLPSVQVEKFCSAAFALRWFADTYGVVLLFNTSHMDDYWYNEPLFTGKCLHLSVGYCNGPAPRGLQCSNHRVRLASHVV